MYEGQSEEEIAEDLAEYFVAVSREFDPLEPDQIPAAQERGLPVLQNFEVASRIRRFRKPKSMVPGDIFPSLVTELSDFFAIPLTSIYNEISTTKVWPSCWKKEYVTIIPKVPNPQSKADLRNISCTMLSSKIYESYVLDWMKQEVSLRSNQYGGVKGMGTDHVLVQVWQRILEDLDDYRAATVVTSIDYSKAFNRMSYQHCLKSLAKKGASSPILQLVATFLTNRRMVVKVGQTHSKPKDVWGGCPQGSILGVFLFNSTIDDLEEGCPDVEEYKPVIMSVETAAQSSNGERKDTDGTDDRSSEEEATLEAADRSNDSTEEEDFLTPAAAGGLYSSTPSRSSRPSTSHSPTLSPVGRTRGRRCIKKRVKRLNITAEGRLEVPPEPNARTESKWKATLMALLRYIDDGFGLSKVNFENSYGFEVNGIFHRVKHAVQAQNVFRHMVRGAEDIGMVVNAKKTAMLCISDSLSYQADAYIHDSDQNQIGCQDKLKALGMYFSSRPNMNAQVESIAKKFRSRYWTLRNLKNSGFTEDELVTVYKTIIRPVADYACVVYHSSLTDEQDELLDRLQNNALKCIFGPMSGRKLREKAVITTLRERREDICDKFAIKLASNPLFAGWFPLKNTRSSTRHVVNKELYKEEKARCDRLKNSPLFYFRRRLNGKIGKSYGKRNEEYRV